MELNDRLYTIQAMQQFGGSFAAALAEAWARADLQNGIRIEQAFPDMVQNYGPGSAFYRSVAETEVTP